MVKNVWNAYSNLLSRRSPLRIERRKVCGMPKERVTPSNRPSDSEGIHSVCRFSTWIIINLNYILYFGQSRMMEYGCLNVSLTESIYSHAGFIKCLWPILCWIFWDILGPSQHPISSSSQFSIFSRQSAVKRQDRLPLIHRAFLLPK